MGEVVSSWYVYPAKLVAMKLNYTHRTTKEYVIPTLDIIYRLRLAGRRSQNPPPLLSHHGGIQMQTADLTTTEAQAATATTTAGAQGGHCKGLNCFGSLVCQSLLKLPQQSCNGFKGVVGVGKG